MMDGMQAFRQRLRAALCNRWNKVPGGVRRAAPLVLVLLIGLVIGATVFGRAAHLPAAHDHGIHAADGADVMGDAVEWTCSMHPQVRQPGPGTCPICGMELIPVAVPDADIENGDLPRLVVSERAAALMQVQVWPVERRAGTADVRLAGTIGYDETQVQDVVVRVEGQVERLHVGYGNARVRRGQHLADIFSPAIQAASAELLQARRAAQAGGMPELVEAAASQLGALGVAQSQIDRILETGEPARTVSIFSPADGVVAELAARQGDWLMPGDRLMRVTGLDRLWVQFEAYERDLARLRVGSRIEYTVEAFPGRAFTGTIAFIDPVIDGDRRTARVRVQLPNPGGALKPGMLVRGQGAITPAAAAPALAIPASAPLHTGQRALVYVQLPDAARPTFEAREVTLGERRGDAWEVLAGLVEGELVVVHGAFRIDSELQIRGQPSMMAPAQQQRRPAEQDHARVPVRLPAAAERELERVVAAYLDVTHALTRDDTVAARRAARAFAAALSAAEFSGAAAGAVAEWRRARDTLHPRAVVMATASDIAVLRRELVQVSARLEQAVRAFPTARVGPLYRVVCPMVDGREGTWLSRQDTVRNPYFGAAKLACGTVTGRVAGP